VTERFPEDPGAAAVLREIGSGPARLLGRGGEASVYALDDERVLRIHRHGASETGVRGRTALLDELQASAHQVSFAIPRVLTVDFIRERWVTVELRLAGRSLENELATLPKEARTALVRAYLSAATELGKLAVSRPFFGELHEDDPVRDETWQSYLERRARHSLALGGEAYSRVSAAELARPFEEPPTRHFVYLDAYPGNVLVEKGRVSAILDFGGGVLIGDPRFNALAAASYLHSEDRAVGEAWLADRGIVSAGPFRRWLAAYWAFASDDETLGAWCRAELVEDGASAKR
jgi:Ser/Thr protein kinase RdoA (MazF antagonist)